MYPTSSTTVKISILIGFLCHSVEAFTSSLHHPRNNVHHHRIGRSPRSSPLDAASAHIIDLEDSNYASLLSSDTPVLIDACAPWCGPCKLIEPVLNRCAEKWGNSLTVAKFNVEGKNPNLKLDILLEGVMPRSLPSLILFHKSKAITTHDGVITDDQLEEFLRDNIPAAVKSNDNSNVPNPAINQTNTTSRKKAGFVSLGGQQGDDYMLQQGV